MSDSDPGFDAVCDRGRCAEGAAGPESVEVRHRCGVGCVGHMSEVGGGYGDAHPLRPCWHGQGMGGGPFHHGFDDVVGWEVVGWGVGVVLWLVGDDHQMVLSPAAGETHVQLGAAAGYVHRAKSCVHGERLDTGLCGGVPQVEVIGRIRGGEDDSGGLVFETVR